MLRSIRKIFSRLTGDKSGNATLLVAIGMPALIGTSGLAVDTAQWYMWKRELQNAVDQAALAGAWAKTSSTSSSDYTTRAKQEFNANLATTSSIATVPVVSLAKYNGSSTDNSVIVSASATKKLPFSSMLTSKSTTVSVIAQATFSSTSSYTACLIGLGSDGTDITIGGSAQLTAKCGLAALSSSASSIVINGQPTVDPGWVVSAGGIDSWLASHTTAEIHAYMSGLTDPFANTTTPTVTPTTAQSYNCVAGSTTTTATVSSYYELWSYTYTASKQNQLGSYPTAPTSSTKTYTSATSTSQNQSVSNGTTAGTSSSGATTTTGTASSSTTGSGKSAVTTWTRTDTIKITYTTYSNVKAVTTETLASMVPGTYKGGFTVGCKTTLQSGVYIIDGGTVKITAQYDVTGTGIMFILKNGANIDITGGSNVTLTAATSAELQNKAGLDSTTADKFAGMLFYEDRATGGSKQSSTINGTSSTILNGKIYLPKSDIKINGTAGVTSSCLLIAASTITLEGNANMSSFCPSGMTETDSVSSSSTSIKLVA